MSQREDIPPFASQFDEIDRAIDNLVKSGKLWNAPRRDSVPMMGRPYPEYDPRLVHTVQPRHHSISDFDGSRMQPAAHLQGFYASQRYQGRPNEVEQMMQAKRRMAAQRERELRNYHQEQQYNRSLLAEMSANKSDRSVSPAAMSEESRRELLARQHRALYGNDSPAFFPPGSLGDDSSRPEGQTGGTPSSTSAIRGSSPRSVDPFGLGQTQGQGTADGVAQVTGPNPSAAAALQSPNRANSTSSPNPGPYGVDQSVTSSPPGESETSRQQPPTKTNIGSVGPIGSRPIQQTASVQGANSALNKRSTTPLPSALGFGFMPNDAPASGSGNELSSPSGNTTVPSSSTGTQGAKDAASSAVGLSSWGNGSGVWGSKSGLSVPASVWG